MTATEFALRLVEALCWPAAVILGISFGYPLGKKEEDPRE